MPSHEGVFDIGYGRAYEAEYSNALRVARSWRNDTIIRALKEHWMPRALGQQVSELDRHVALTAWAVVDAFSSVLMGRRC